MKNVYIRAMCSMLILFGATETISARSGKRINFSFEQEDITTIINYVASLKRVNIILPPSSPPLAFKVSFSSPKKVNVKQAFNFLHTILDVAGYKMDPHGPEDFIIKKKTPNSSRDPLPLYIGITPDKLPDSNQYIRYLYYFENFKVQQKNNVYTQEMRNICNTMLSENPNPKLPSPQVMFHQESNSVLLLGKASSVKNAMKIIGELDKTGFREAVEIIKITNTSASFVSKFINTQLLNPSQGQKPITVNFAQTLSSQNYFSVATKVVPIEHSNSLILIGKEEAIERLKAFIYKYLDTPIESGASIVHIYDLQYLQAETFKTTLGSILKPAQPASQSKGEPKKKRFQNVIIEAETFEEVKTEHEHEETFAGLRPHEVGKIFRGGNRLVIAANKRDWLYVRDLIKELDKPQPQVAIEVLIADVTLDKNKIIASQVRNKPGSPVNSFAMQAAHIDEPVPIKDPSTLLSNLLQLTTKSGESAPGSNLAGRASAGSLILSFNDTINNGIWWVMHILREYTNSRILSHPHNIVLNHTRATISLKETRLVDGRATKNPDGTITVEKENIEAKLAVDVLPRISLLNSINLDIEIRVQDFINRTATDNSKTTRLIRTNATVGNGEVLVLGGTVKTKEDDTLTKTPILAQIPLIGWLFKKKAKNITKDNLMVFVSPTIIKPQHKGGMSAATEKKFEYGKSVVSYDGNRIFGQLKDPINHWFFKSPHDSTIDLIDDYAKKTKKEEKEIPTVKKELPPKNLPISKTKGKLSQAVVKDEKKE